ncbi:MAG TPA: penicillin-binding protein 2 [Alphaproteobacteria bacterium]|nr:penicillin-binding protein 2 [Alphaproteobacteria bacterium]
MAGDWRKPFARPGHTPGHGDSGRDFTRKRNPLQQRRVKVQAARSFRDPLGIPDEPVSNIQFRAVVTLFTLVLAMTSIGARLAYVGMSPPMEPRPSLRAMPVEPLRRGNIYDRNGILLAATVKVYSLYADPVRILDVKEAATKLHALFPDLPAEGLRDVLGNRDRRFVWLKRRLSPKQAQDANALGLPGIAFREEYVRVYPLQNVASHILGAVDVDNNGLAGVERYYDSDLKKGHDLTLALDLTAQDLLRDSVRDATYQAGAKSGWGVVLDSKTGEIIAMTSQPDYDPNHFGHSDDTARFNRAALASYEMGSTFKLFTLAQGLSDGVITPETPIDCRFPIKIDKYTIKDYHAKHAILTAREVLRYSSNVGAALIADKSGPAAQKAFMDKMGMLKPLSKVGISEIGPVRYPHNWGRVETFTIAFGHGIMVTPLHLVAAANALVSDGVYRPPVVLKGGEDQSSWRQVLDNKTVLQVRDLMRDVVVNGSGRSASVPGYDIGGKTGTAEKIGARGYDHSKNVVSFLASLPLDNPRFTVLIMLDEPKKGFETGGKSAAPAVGAFVRRYALVAGLAPNMEAVRATKEGYFKSLSILDDPDSENEQGAANMGPDPADPAEQIHD